VNLFDQAEQAPNVDYFTREDLKAFVKQFKDDTHNGALNEVSAKV
jgi:hypothetical protein